jgi:hypothetical protein
MFGPFEHHITNYSLNFKFCFLGKEQHVRYGFFSKLGKHDTKMEDYFTDFFWNAASKADELTRVQII